MPMITVPTVKTAIVPRSASQMVKEVRVKQDLMPSGKYGRKNPRKLNIKYITIHSTQNKQADAARHALALNRGRLGGNSWHFTVDQGVAIQHVPLTEMAHHSDYGGPGNKTSIGIEMCENYGNNMPRTYDRTAKLTAVLMKQYKVPLKNVVPHFYWTGKDCPNPLLENGVPGYRWGWFLSRVDYYYRCINNGVSYR